MKDILKAIVYGGLFAIPFLTLYVENDYFFPFITGKNFWFRIIIDVVVAAWVLLALYDTKYRPKFSWILVSFSVLLIVMFFANLFGVHPESSFLSNFERMDGYVSLVHTFLYMTVLGSMLTTKEHWQRLLNTSLVVAFLVALYGLAQYGGLVDGSGRIDSRLGNAAYMAVYMLFHIFISFWLFVESKQHTLKAAYAFLAILFTFVLIETGTRGTAIGLAVGIFVMSGYIGLFGVQFKEFRKYAIGAFVALLIVVAGFIAGKDSAIVQHNPNLARIANISFNDLTIRGTIWGMAWEGVKERPLLGWGQSNFNYVFNQQYQPSLYAQEQWFDRSHNIIFDWLIAGGFLGLIAYLSIFVASVYYLLIRPLRQKTDNTFTVLERGVLLGILAGYVTHNIVVFDNIISYIFFAIILGLIHSRVATPMPEVQKVKVEEPLITQFTAPVILVLLGAIIYFVHMPGMATAHTIITAMREQNLDTRLNYFKDALGKNSFGEQEVVEQLSQNTLGVVRDPKASAETKEAFTKTAEEALLALAEKKPGDARIHVFIGTFYRATGQFEKAAEQMALARSFSPRKQTIIGQQGFVALSLSKTDEALGYFEEAFLLDERNLEAREYYASALFEAGKTEEAIALMDSDNAKQRFAKSDFLLGAAYKAKQTDFLIELFKTRIENNPDVAQNWASLAFLYHEVKDNAQAIETLKEGMKAVPAFTASATCIIDNITNNRPPETECTDPSKVPNKK
jgi:O-antigen ligase/tetratricopeptide (TPR) repeat protein